MPRLILFDDERARAWEPFALTRPIGELLLGTLTMRQRAERVFGFECAGHLSAPHLAGFDEEGAPPVMDRPETGDDGDALVVLSRFVPAWGEQIPRFDRGPGAIGDQHGNTIGWVVDDRDSPVAPGMFTFPSDERPPRYLIRGTLLEHPWDLIAANPEQITRDIEAAYPHPSGYTAPAGVYQWGDHPLIVHPTATIEPGCVVDTTGGPVLIDERARVKAFTRLGGPAYVGRDSVVLGGPVEAVSIGPMCRVRGELAESICLGYVNKQHDGHIGHAYLGRWVNLGAETTNSDLKNNYGTIRVWTPEGPTDTGLIKMGSLIGDHVKTGIGLLLNTGTVVGAGSNLFGAAMPPVYVPPFSWGQGDDLVEYRIDKFLEVAERSMARRKVDLSESAREQLRAAWKRARGGGEAIASPVEPS